MGTCMVQQQGGCPLEETPVQADSLLSLNSITVKVQGTSERNVYFSDNAHIDHRKEIVQIEYS